MQIFSVSSSSDHRLLLDLEAEKGPISKITPIVLEGTGSFGTVKATRFLICRQLEDTLSLLPCVLLRKITGQFTIQQLGSLYSAYSACKSTLVGSQQVSMYLFHDSFINCLYWMAVQSNRRILSRNHSPQRSLLIVILRQIVKAYFP